MTLTLRKRIVLTLIPLLTLFLILSGAGVVLIYRLGTRIDAILRENYDSVIWMEHLGDALERIDSSFQFTLAGREAKARDQYQTNWKIYRENLSAEQGNITVPGEKELVDELTALTERYAQQGKAFYTRAADDPHRNSDYFDAGGLHQTFMKIKSVAGQIARINEANMEDANRKARRTAVRSLVGFAIGLAVCVGLAAFATWHVFHSVLDPIRAVTQSAQGISTGNFDQVVPYLSADALGQLAEAFNQMTRRLREEKQSTEQRTKELVQTTETLRAEISERERMEHELRRLAAIVESSDDAIVGQSLDGTITTWNKGAERMFGYCGKSIVGQPQSILVPPDRENESPAIRARIQRGEHVNHFETVRSTRDGQRIFVSLTISPVKDETGKLVGVASIGRNISERKQAEEQIRRLAQLQSAIAGLGQRALRTESTAGLLDEAVGAVATNLDVDFCNVLELLPGGEELLLKAGIGWKEGVVGHAMIKTQGTQPGFVIRSECPVIVGDAATETRFELLPKLLGEDVTSAMSVVISTPQGPYGALGAHSRRQRSFAQDEVNFLQAVANVLGAAIQRKRSEERLRQSNRALLALSSCNQALIRATQETDLLQQICQVVVEKAGYRHCWVGYAEQDEGKTVRPVAQAGFDEGYLKTVNVTWADTERGQGPTGTCIRTGHTALVKNMATDPQFAPWRAEALKRGYASSIAIPLMSNSTAFGALTIYASEPDAFGNEEVQLLTELADDLAFGVMGLRTRAERAKAVEFQAAHEREIQIGSEIQETLLVDPLPTNLRGLRVAAITVASQQIDGDFYYFYKHEDQRVDLIVADVMGKGIPAALLGAATKSHFLEALCHLLYASPAGVLPEPREIVTLAHAVMAQHLIDLESFVTACYVRLDPDRRTLEFVDAGHTGLLLYKAAIGRCEILHGDNFPLGVRKGEIYNQQSVFVGPNDLVVLYSDGVTEARSPADELFGEDRLTQCIESNSGLEPEDLAKAIRKAVFAFSESESPTDDLTCVVIKIVESECPLARANLEIRSDFLELGRAREFVRAFCRELPGTKPDEEYVGKIELAVTEACSNIMKHAFERRTDQQIQMEAESFPDRISIRLYHLGDPFDPSQVSQPRLDGSQESGFGVHLITQCVDDVRYDRDERGRSCITLTKKRQQQNTMERANGING